MHIGDVEAESLLDLLELVGVGNRRLVVLHDDGTGPPMDTVPRLRLAMQLREAPAGLQFRAIVEEWDVERLVKELW